MTRRSVRILSTALVTVALVLTGCSTSGPTGGRPTTDVGITLPGGMVTSRSGAFTVVVPLGWGEATDQLGAQIDGLDLVLLSSKKVSKFSNNLVVITTTGDAAAVAQELEKGRAQVTDADQEVSQADDVEIAGVTATGFTTKLEQDGLRITARTLGMVYAGKMYLLRFSSSQDDAANAVSAFDEITGSWKWL